MATKILVNKVIIRWKRCRRPFFLQIHVWPARNSASGTADKTFEAKIQARLVTCRVSSSSALIFKKKKERERAAII